MDILLPYLVKKIGISQVEAQVLYLLGGKYIFNLKLHMEMCHIPMYVKLPLESWYPHHFSSVDYESFYNRVILANPDEGILTSQRKCFACMMLICPPILFATSTAAVTSL